MPFDPIHLLTTTFAYLDPGSGSFILQLLLASLFGALFVVKAYWKKIKGAIRGLFSKRRQKPEE